MRITLAFLACTAVLCPCLAQNPVFQRLDKNKDLQLTKDEIPPQRQRLLRMFDRIDADGSGSVSSEELAAYRKQAQNALLPKGIKVLRDLPYVKDGHPRHVLDLYLPEQKAKANAAPALVVFIHGGGWQNGSKDNPRVLVPLIKHGFAVASINYRLSQHATFPAQIHDCKAAIRWLRAKASEYGYNGKQIGVWGSSAGGHLVALLGASGDVKELEGDLGVTNVSSRVQAVCDYFGPSDLTLFGDKNPHAEENPNSKSPITKLLGHPVSKRPDIAKAASPITYVTADDPPFYIVHGDKDRLVPIGQSERLKAALEKAGVKTQYRVVTGAGHGHFRDPKVAQSVVAFFAEVLNKADTKTNTSQQAEKATAQE